MHAFNLQTKPLSLAERLADLAVDALIDEADLSPKPALVDRRGNGAHTDLHLGLMHASALSLWPMFKEMAEAALEVGLVNRVVPPTECNMLTQMQARKLAAKSLASLMETKRLLKKGNTAELLERINEEAASFGRMLGEPASKEAFTAFMEKRAPDFSKL